MGLWKLSENGKQNLLRIYSENSFFGYRSLLGQDEYYASTIALKPSQVLYFPFNDISELQNEVPEVFQYFTVFLASELKEAELRLTRASSMKMKHRVINTLLYLKKHHGDYTWTYREIGEYCGGETETVIRICNQLKHAGVLQKESRHWKIVNEQKLIAMQNEH
ncbi:CRP-like cAMP-binding protein [Endozoicomonas sp. NE40]|uniref:CRP-like cAMP-binding protein n=3 Tax=Endozoicomonas lisbonensis TaxID=3120522 RepID=A0ABV2SG20_9GAMM